MKKIAWITDSTAALSDEYIKKHNIFVLPLNIIFENDSFQEAVNLSPEEFYQKLEASHSSPKTSQPAIGEFVELYEKLKSEFDMGIAIHASSKLTGTYQSSLMASKMTSFSIVAIDSKIGSSPLRHMIEKGIELYENGISFDEIVSTLESMPEKARLIFTPGSLEQLHKSGRVSGTKLLIGNLLQIKLLLNFDNGEVVVQDKIRTMKKMKVKMMDILEEKMHYTSINKVTILHGNVLDQALAWKDELSKKFENIVFETELFGAVVGVHAGSGTLGLAWNE